LERVTRTYPHAVWLNPTPEEQWDYTHSIKIVRQLFAGRMFPLTLAGLDGAMRELVR
ncbi:MAG TPA: VWA domain-containing protein, partial [Xanthobacteraceae bacterium]|nr:VWA domain-containing protein [Xanthobacteraceae bacterium]